MHKNAILALIFAGFENDYNIPMYQIYSSQEAIMNQDPTRQPKPITLAQETVRFGGMILDYRLNAYPSRIERFRIRITSGDECAESTIGNDIDAALRIYRAILHGRVTPCGLDDVMYDLKSV